MPGGRGDPKLTVARGVGDPLRVLHSRPVHRAPLAVHFCNRDTEASAGAHAGEAGPDGGSRPVEQHNPSPARRHAREPAPRRQVIDDLGLARGRHDGDEGERLRRARAHLLQEVLDLVEDLVRVAADEMVGAVE